MTKRLHALVEMVAQCNSAADVGCDHGKVGIQLLLQDKCQTMHFCDISSKSLDKARQKVMQLGLQNRSSFCCCDGLSQVPIVDTAIIAGMGGLEIISILKNAPFLPQSLVLQPMRSFVELRQHLCEHYKITQDYILFDKKFYVCIAATLGSDSLTQQQLLLGRTNLVSPTQDFLMWLGHMSELHKLQAQYDNTVGRNIYLDLLRSKENK